MNENDTHNIFQITLGVLFLVLWTLTPFINGCYFNGKCVLTLQLSVNVNMKYDYIHATSAKLTGTNKLKMGWCGGRMQ